MEGSMNKNVYSYFNDYKEVLESLENIVGSKILSTLKILHYRFIADLAEKQDFRLNSDNQRKIWDDAYVPIKEYHDKLKMCSIYSEDFYRVAFIQPSIYISHFYNHTKFDKNLEKEDKSC